MTTPHPTGWLRAGGSLTLPDAQRPSCLCCKQPFTSTSRTALFCQAAKCQAVAEERRRERNRVNKVARKKRAKASANRNV